MSRTARIGVDVGGTFTDLLLHDPARGLTWPGKLPTTPHAPHDAITAGITRLLAETGTDPGDVACVVHGTTLVTNTLLERTGAVVGLLTTEGFTDTLEMAREIRFDPTDLHARPAPPLVPRHLCRGVPGRLAADGTEVAPLDEGAVSAQVADLLAHGVEAVAVALLHSYRDDRHERRVRELVARAHPDLPVTLSSAVTPMLGEYERASTACLNAYVQPLVAHYLDALRADLTELGIDAPLHVMLSGGGVTTLDDAKAFPVRLLESGPAAGAIAAAAVARRAGEPDVLSFDMGGTTAKIAIVSGGAPRRKHDFEAGRVDKFKPGSGLPVKLTVVDLIEIGSGGGSIAAPDALGLLKVGPRSAGSVPGPVAYGRGGEQPTVTDADLVLGYLDPDAFLGGEMRLRTDEVHKAVARDVGDPLDLDETGAAAGIIEVATASMAAAARTHLAEHGRDPAGFALVAFGGAGPVHAYGLAKQLKIARVIVPMRAGVMSAYGFLVAAPTVDLARSLPSPLSEVDWNRVDVLYAEMAGQATAVLGPGASLRRSADLRYLGQGSEIEVELPEGDGLRGAFEDTYRAAFGRTLDGPVEVVNWRLTARLPGPDVELGCEPVDGDPRRGERDVYFPGHGRLHAAVWDRYRLRPGTELTGPAVFEERESSCSFGPGCRIRVGDDLTLFVDVG
ncbi:MULTISPECIES: hydantoinase/oxoprolinase family protein [unclassified Amycolatopsis]|uniref:hydantoinase/oxoprolinase family protein n=1 Tax=unclassified Amycolatopsis TaxID=2618356 RepID=UPI0028760B20|nr:MULTISPECIES: hydantoinase/oxoprolinase family protein [unclassified Amycolatopsis]MDS0139950.1 hydantoinase/oxoprolinase family protein [Amycolatopsis sp. 505]MDS0148138.1 hydantoinase/oxoprolinase family protein [Amycolatopsis sp. CM201R]